MRTSIFTFFFGIFGAIVLHWWIAQPIFIRDEAMSPGLRRGDIVIVNRLPYFFGNLQRGDTVVFRDAEQYARRYVRRIVGLPGERVIVKDGILSLEAPDGSKTTEELALFGTIIASIRDQGNLDENEYFVLPNTAIQEKSGILDERFIIGKPYLRIWPLNKINFLY